MQRNDRREFLKLCAASMPLTLSRWPSTQAIKAATAHRTPSSIDRYIDTLPRLETAAATHRLATRDVYNIRMMECQHQLHSQLPATRLWGYQGQYPGPIIEASQGRTVQVQWENHLPATHMFPIDARITNSRSLLPGVRTVPHLHGAHTDSESDGLPEHSFSPGKSALYTYPNRQRASTLWYHDHAMGITRLNVYAGLSGFYLLRDDEERSMRLPSGEYEIPIVLQDRTLDERGQLIYQPTMDDGKPLAEGEWGPMFFGELPVANGAIYPYIDVRPQRYRLRLLNGSNSRFLRLSFNQAKRPTDIPRFVQVHQIGSDGGFLPTVVPLESLDLAPGERADLLIDFSSLAGETVTLVNDAPAPYPGWNVMNGMWPSILEFMQFRVTLNPDNAIAYSLPPLKDFPRLDETTAVKTRDFILSEDLDEHGRSLGLKINDMGYMEANTESVVEGTTEIWRFINTSDDAHPMHLHLVQFQILHRQGFDLGTYKLNRDIRPVGAMRPPQPNEGGWKDTAVVNPGDILSIIAHFAGFTGRYVFHCHMLEHEDNDMMRPFMVISAEHPQST